jgi:hypothetical protein
MNIQNRKQSKKRIGIKTMQYWLTETCMSINTIVLIYISTSVLNYCHTAVWKYRYVSVEKHRINIVNQYLITDL